ncbi:hypothetical protein EDD16DRAFT_1730916 [Pisolithus croceorrhizus]|nr:hypothetical protein EDD16DRAFT_1730916 [Pisolithus croceorrhizus]KAI6131000.1 hypothetical protein EV401DRAFT_1884218 [Pisolithus croceorrhizus]KAI6167549.1 hypothetical protein EDD17DRAFT_1504164 [Pisolithus thermaeus]
MILIIGPYCGRKFKRDAALHFGILHRETGASVSTQIATLRNLLLNHDNSRRGQMFQAGTLTLTVDAKDAGIIASLLTLKAEVETQSIVPMKMTNSPRSLVDTKENVLTTLIKNSVTVGIGHQGVEEVVMSTGWAAQNMRWDTA